LEGLRVVNADGVDLGVVSHLFSTGANAVMVVHGERERMVPFVQPDYILAVDLDAGQVTVDWDPEFRTAPRARPWHPRRGPGQARSRRRVPPFPDPEHAHRPDQPVPRVRRPVCGLRRRGPGPRARAAVAPRLEP